MELSLYIQQIFIALNILFIPKKYTKIQTAKKYFFRCCHPSQWYPRVWEIYRQATILQVTLTMVGQNIYAIPNRDTYIGISRIVDICEIDVHARS